MPRAIDPRRIEVIDDATASMLRAKSGTESLSIAFGMFDFAVEVVMASVKDQHPDWDAGQISREVARRIRGAAA